ncbi:MAG: NADP-dependent malic enzyme [Candidatus Aminicenantes bacterium]|nr:NADP-dependent malic enzyme [Candidatus Aminicenantes bacterium]
MEKVTVEELLQRAAQPAKDAPRLHKYYKGKLGVALKCRVRDFNDFAIWYTPGVAAVCKEIAAEPQKAYEYTNKWNSVAVISDGTRVLGLGDIGPLGALPVMEGKGILYKYLGGVDAFPICLDEKDPDKIIEIGRALQPSFGGYNLEDLSQPKCFRILDELRSKCEIPVWHDDQQGTACVTVAGVINALKIVKKNIAEAKVTVVGAGASGINIAHQIMLAGANGDNMLSVDTKGILHRDRADRDVLQEKYKEKWSMCMRTNPKCKSGNIPDAIAGADVLICVSTPGPGTIKPEWIKTMAKDAIVFAEANPIPEIWPWEAKEAGARVVATGRSDFPNQVNNSLGFPGIFRGALDVRAKTITDEMCIAAARELAKVAEDKGLSEDYIIPNMDEWEVFPREAAAVATKAIEQGVARFKFTPDELLAMAKETIGKARNEVKLMMKENFIIDPDK